MTKWKKYSSKNEKIRQMETRNEEFFKIKTADTERLKRSPIAYMQYLLCNYWANSDK